MSRRSSNKRGVTFIEVMVTVVIFSAAMVGIFKAFITSLDQLNYLTHRLYASMILDHHIATIERVLRVERTLPLNAQAEETLDIDGRKIVFEQEFAIEAVEDLIDVFHFHLTLKWKEGTRLKTLSRSVYINDFSLTYPEG